MNYRIVMEDLTPYKPGKPISEVQRELGLEKVIKLASNENPLGSSPKAKAAVMEYAKNMALYPDGNSADLKEALAAKLGISPAMLMLGAGSDEIVAYIAQVFVEAGDNTIMGFPTFPRYETVTRIMGGTPVELPLTGDYGLDLDAFIKNINTKTKIIWLCNPNNPTGTMISAEEQRHFLSQVPKDIMVILDEAYYEYARGGDYPESLSLLDEFDNLIILRTFSKAYGLAGLRVGYAISSERTINYLNRVRAPFNVTAAAQAGALAALLDEDFIQASLDNNEKGKKYLYEAFASMDLPYIPTFGNFIMVRIQKDSLQVFIELLKKGVIIRTGDIFKMNDWIRVTVGTPEENALFIKALNEVL